jgi:hypothetical protein
VDFNDSKLQRIIYDGDTLSTTERVPAESPAVWQAAVTLDPTPEAQAVGVFTVPDELNIFLLARAEMQGEKPIYEVVAFSRTDLTAMSGGVKMLVDTLFYEPISKSSPLEPYTIPTVPTLTVDRRQLALSQLSSQVGDIKSILALLGAALHERGLLIRGYTPELDARLDLVQSLMMLLPQIVRPDMTFATQVDDSGRARITFSKDAQDSVRWTADFSGETPLLPPLDEVRSPYINALESIWTGDPRHFAGELRAMELIHIRYPDGKSLNDALSIIAERYMQDKEVMTGGNVPMEQVKAALNNASIPTAPELRARYAELLLDQALNNRDAEAASLVTRLMDEDPSLDFILNRRLEEALETQPDAVYFVIRAHLVQSEPINGRWLPRLQNAAFHSLRVAIGDSETETLNSWLRLIVREPAAYQLGEVLQVGILSAQERARTDGELGAQLLIFTAKRAPNTVETLLNDPLFVSALPEAFSSAVRDYDPDALRGLLSQGRQLYLIVLSRAATIPQAARAFSPETIDQLWAMRADEQAAPMPDSYQPSHLFSTLLSETFMWLPVEGATRFVTLILTNQEDIQFSSRVHEVIRRAQERDQMVLPNALHQSQLPVDSLQSLIAGAINAGVLTQQAMVNLYLQLLDLKGWQRPALPLAEAVARSLQQNHALTLPAERVWRLLQTAADLRSDQIARVMTRRLTADLEKIEGERELGDMLNRLTEQLHWNTNARNLVLNWWREWIRGQPLNRLQQIDKALDGRKALEELRDVLQTHVALRRIFGKGRTLEDFANGIGMTLTILQALSDSFDPAPKHPATLDQTTLRGELEARRDELTPDERRVLARNLKELSNLIVEMSEHRSRANLMRREDELQRQLMTGEHQPQSAVDMMKWLSGYLEGIQPVDEDEG